MLHSNLTQEEARKLFAFFLGKIGVEVKFRKTDYGYRTYDSKYKIFIEKNRIVRHRNVRIWKVFEYRYMLEELVFEIVRTDGFISAKTNNKLYYYG